NAGGVPGRDVVRPDRKSIGTFLADFHGRRLAEPKSQEAGIAFILPLDDEFLLPAVLLGVLYGNDDEDVDMRGAQLLQDGVDVPGTIALMLSHGIVRREVREEVPRQDRGLVAPAQRVKRLAEGDPFRLVGRVEPRYAMVETGLGDSSLVRLGSGRVGAELPDERWPS